MEKNNFIENEKLSQVIEKLEQFTELEREVIIMLLRRGIDSKRLRAKQEEATSRVFDNIKSKVPLGNFF